MSPTTCGPRRRSRCPGPGCSSSTPPRPRRPGWTWSRPGGRPASPRRPAGRGTRRGGGSWPLTRPRAGSPGGIPDRDRVTARCPRCYRLGWLSVVRPLDLTDVAPVARAPLAPPDESAYLIAARVMSGGVSADFSYSTLYPAGYPLLITPVFWFTHNPVTVYHAVLMGINAPLSALIMPLGYVCCPR